MNHTRYKDGHKKKSLRNDFEHCVNQSTHCRQLTCGTQRVQKSQWHNIEDFRFRPVSTYSLTDSFDSLFFVSLIDIELIHTSENFAIGAHCVEAGIVFFFCWKYASLARAAKEKILRKVIIHEWTLKNKPWIVIGTPHDIQLQPNSNNINCLSCWPFSMCADVPHAITITACMKC